MNGSCSVETDIRLCFCGAVVLKPLELWAGVLPEESCHGRAPCLYPTSDGLLRIRSLCTGFQGETTGNNLYFPRISVKFLSLIIVFNRKGYCCWSSDWGRSAVKVWMGGKWSWKQPGLSKCEQSLLALNRGSAAIWGGSVSCAIIKWGWCDHGKCHILRSLFAGCCSKGWGDRTGSAVVQWNWRFWGI